MCFSQTVEELDYVWVFMDNPNLTTITGVYGNINDQPFTRQIAELDSISNDTWGIKFSSTEYGQFRFHEMITVSAAFSFEDTSIIGSIADTCRILLAGDFNDDNRVNGMDLEEFKKVFGRTGVGYRTFEDMNRDGRVDGRDLQEWKQYNGRSWIPTCN
jgi:hypothetical protein